MLKITAILIILVLLISGGFYLVFRSPFFRVADLQIIGSQKDDEIKAELVSTFSKNSRWRTWLGPENLFFWSFQIIKEIPSSLFWLSDISLQEDWSSRKIYIEVQERQPYLIWCLQNNNCYWTDETGIIFARAPQVEGFIIPEIIASSSQSLILGQPFFNKPDLVKNTLEIIKQVKNSLLPASQFFIKDVNLQEITAKINNLELDFSLRSLPQNFNQLLTNLANRVDFSKLKYIDFRVENRLYYQ